MNYISKEIRHIIAAIILAVLFFTLITAVAKHIPFDLNNRNIITIGESNGNFLGEYIHVQKVDYKELKVGDFVVREINGELIVHPIIKILKSDGKIIGFYAKGIENKEVDPFLYPSEVLGRAFKILEDGSIEEDTKYVQNLH